MKNTKQIIIKCSINGIEQDLDLNKYLTEYVNKVTKLETKIKEQEKTIESLQNKTDSLKKAIALTLEIAEEGNRC